MPSARAQSTGEQSSPWPKSCAEAPTKHALSRDMRRFCLDFAADYFYRLRFTKETMVYRSGDRQQTYDRPKFSTEGALFLLAQARVESNWADDVSRSYKNYWGLHGKPKIMKFSTMDQALGFYFNHLERGIGGDATDLKGHPGWPSFLERLTREPITTQELNEGLHSGPYCKTYPSYNNAPLTSCQGDPKCPCVDYAGIIREQILPQVVSICLRAYDDYDREPAPGGALKSDIYPEATGGTDADGSLPNESARLAVAREEMLRYAQNRCGIQQKPADSSTEAPGFSAALEAVEGAEKAATEPPSCP